MIRNRVVWHSFHSQPCHNIFAQKFALVSSYVLASSYYIRTLVCLLLWVLNKLTNIGGNEIGSRHAIASVNILRLSRTRVTNVTESSTNAGRNLQTPLGTFAIWKKWRTLWIRGAFLL